MGKKGLAVVYDPHNLYQFIWYYCNRGKNKKWDALCLPNANKGEYMHQFCDSAGIFDRVYKDNTEFSMLPKAKKFRVFLSMFIHFIMGKRKEYCKKILKQYVDLDEYDEIVIISDVGIVSGACTSLGDEKDVIILEDGVNDYGKRIAHIPINKLFSSYAWQGFLLSKMGYCSPGWFELKTDRFCIKYCSQPEKMKNRSYREMRTLYAEEGTDYQLFDCIIRRVYPQINNFDFSKFDAVVMTRPLEDFVDQEREYITRFCRYVSENCRSVLVKKHPREEKNYDFGKNVAITEVDKALPAEVLLPYLKGKKIIILTVSSIIMYLKSFGLSCEIIVFDKFFEDSKKSHAKGKAPSINDIETLANTLCDGGYKVVTL